MNYSNNNNKNNNNNNNKYEFNTTKIKSIKINGILNSKYQFDLKYPNNIHGVIDSTEFNNIIQSINDRISSILPSTFYIYLIPILLGILVIIAGLNSMLLWFGISITILGILGLIINILFFQSNVEEKIIDQLRIINQKYRERIIIFSLHTEVVYKSIDQYEYQLNKNKLSFKSQLVYDDIGNPYKSSKDMYILMAFQSNNNENYYQDHQHNDQFVFNIDEIDPFHLPMFDIIPNYENFNCYSINNNINNNDLSISMTSLY